MEEKRTGRQTPTRSVVLPYKESLGGEALELYNRSGRKALPWQELMTEDIMAVGEDGLWVHMKFGWSIPRRNGKSEILIMRSLWALTHGQRVLYTAHRITTSHNAWEKVLERLEKAGFVPDEDFKSIKANGMERIEWLDSDAIINFRTRSSKGGLGEGYDLLIIDEAQEYSADQESALKYVVTDSRNPQTLMCGTPPTAVSSGDVFLKLRKNVLSGKEEDAGWAEWSVPRLTDAHDPELWYETNPSLGYILTERTIRSELGDDQVDDNIQRLGLWLTYSQKSAISRKEWDEYLAKEKPELPKKVRVFYGVKYAKTTENVSLACALKLPDGHVFVEAIDCRPRRDGNAWIIDYLRSPSAEKVVIDGAVGQAILSDDMKNAGVKIKPYLPKVEDVVNANALFEQLLFAGKILHSGQPSLTQLVTNCEHRAIGSKGGFGYASLIDGADVSLIEAVTLAHWAAATAKDKKKPQIIGY
jgi:phage terminase large subunit-like protein